MPARIAHPQVVERLLRLNHLHLTVTVGRDELLRAKIEKSRASSGKPVELHGWTDRMPELVMSHHLLIGKAGGATVQEAIAARTPMLITQVVPGQEEGNAQLLFQNGCGALCETPEALAAQVQALFERGAARWKRWEENIARLSKPDAARAIARFVMERRPLATAHLLRVPFLREITDALVDVGVDRVIGLREVASREKRLAGVLHVVFANGIGEDRREVIDPHARGFQQFGVIKIRMHLARVNQAPAVAESVRIVAFHMEAPRLVVLQNGDRVVPAFVKKFDGLRAELRGVKAIEENRPSAALRVAHFPDEDSFARCVAAPVKLEVPVTEHLDKL
jgi:hypothetical protein